jgi:sucrose-phosphate synthase
MNDDLFSFARDDGIYIMSLSVHGLVRGREMELGRDADTGGQVSYVVEQALAISRMPEVGKVDLVTRRISDQKVDASYSIPSEVLSETARIVRLPFGPRRYLRKESLWPYLPLLVDEIMRYLRSEGRSPDLVHGHYADAGFVGAQVAKILGVPFLFTGHSLGRIKRARLLDGGQEENTLEDRYRFQRRVEAEEGALETAAVVIASTRQEVREQYETYDHYQPDRMRIIPPGVDLTRYSPPDAKRNAASPNHGGSPRMAAEIGRFLRHPDRPLILAMARPDERKNLNALLEAYGRNPELRDIANLLLVVGTREDIGEMSAGPKRVLTQILLLIDKYDLYGKVAYPKAHTPDDVPALYRMAAASGGVFVNPALTEPFGLTLIESAASGLPVVATNDGGPQDILEACQNGVLVDPEDSEEIGNRVLNAITDRSCWKKWAANGIQGAHDTFSWESHAKRYLEVARDVLIGTPSPAIAGSRPRGSRLPRVDRILVTDIDNTLTGNAEAREAFLKLLREAGENVGFAVATGRSLASALEALDERRVPRPDILICATGTAIHYGERLTPDRSWERQIDYHWHPEKVRKLLVKLKGLTLSEDEPPTPFHLRFRRSCADAPGLQEIRHVLRGEGLRVTATLDHERDLDITPVRASPGLAIRFLSYKWDLPPERFLVAGDSGNDADMLAGETLGVIVSNHTPELLPLKNRPRVYFSGKSHAWGILDGIEYYDFFGFIRIPDSTEPTEEIDVA